MRIGDLEALQAALETGSLSAAARQLGCSQPGLSRRLQRLEGDLGVRLLERSAAGVAATPVGARVAPLADEVLAGVARLRHELLDREVPLRGTVRVLASTTPGDHLVPELVATFTEKHPDVRVDVLLADSAQVPVGLLDQRADVGFTGRREPDARLQYTPIADDEVVLAVRKDHRLAGKASVPLSALAGERLVWREQGSGTQQSFVDAVAAAGELLPENSPVVGVSSTQAVIAAVRAGSGIGVVSLRAAEAARRVAAVRITNIPVKRRLWMVHEATRRRPETALAFQAHVKDALALEQL